MIKQKNTTLSWNDRFAVIDEFKPTDKQIKHAFGVTADELGVARTLLKNGTFKPTPGLDIDSYSGIFDSESSGNIKKSKSHPIGFRVKPKDILSETSVIVPGDKKSPMTATKRKPEAKKRGRKGNKIQTAFSAITNDPTCVNTFAETHGVSLAVLRQSKRFDQTGLGKVCVRMDKSTKTVMIWREPLPK